MSQRMKTLRGPAKPSRKIALLLVVLLALLATACGDSELTVSGDEANGPDDIQPTPGTIETEPPVQPTPTPGNSDDPEPEPTPVPVEPTPTPIAESQSVSGAGIAEARGAVVRISQIGDFVTPDGSGVGGGTGSGFIIDPSGIAVTNNHVAGGAAILEVLVDGETEPRSARVLGLSECADLAVIKIEGDDFPFVEFQDGSLPVGTEVLAAGYPLSTTEFTLTRGIISTAELPGETSWASVEAVIEHDARIRPGNSGGPLFTQDGYVAGVNYAGDDQFDFNLAIASQYAQPIIDILSGGESFEAIGLNASAYAFGDVTGLWVNAIETGSPADRAGVKPGDLVTELEGVPLATDGTLRHYCEILRSQGTDDELAIEVIRPMTGEILEGNVNGPDKLSVVFSAPVNEETTPVAQTGEAYTDFVRLTDDTGSISVQVPAAFVETITVAWESDTLGTVPSILAAPNMATAFGSDATAYSGDGVALYGFSGGNIVDTIIELISTDVSRCTYEDEPTEYSTNGFEGFIVLLTNCEGYDMALFFVGAQIPGEDRFVLLGVQVTTEAMLDATPTILSSFRWEN